MDIINDKLMKYIFVAISFAFFIACSNDEKITITDFPSEIKTTAEKIYNIEDRPYNNIISFDIIEPAGCLVEINQDWCSVTYNRMNSPQNVSMEIENNLSNIERKAIMTISHPKIENPLQIEIIQKGHQIRVGDPDVVFDRSLIDPLYSSQMNEWIKAGVQGGVPHLVDQLKCITKEYDSNSKISDINKYLLDNAGKNIIIQLKNGEYRIKEELKLQSNQVLIGESKENVKIYLSEGGLLSMYTRKNSGIRNLTIIGDYKETPPDPEKFEEVLSDIPNVKLRSIDMAGAENCYLDNVSIINSACHPLWIYPKNSTTGKDIGGKYNTIRDVEIDGAYNKGEGCQGYFMVGGEHNLITGCKVTHIRHISMQDPTSKYNVFYKNDLAQDISFHNNDGGDNLVENNRIVTPVTLKSYNAITGPVSTQHKVGGKNFIYLNKCKEENNYNKTPWSDEKLYIGPYEVVVGTATTPARHSNFRVTEGYPEPIGKTLYPIIL